MSMRTDAIETIKDEQWYAYSDITKDKSGSEEHSCIADAVFWEDLTCTGTAIKYYMLNLLLYKLLYSMI